MSRTLTLAGYLAIATGALVLELVARFGSRRPSLGDFVGVCVRFRYGRAVMLAVWLWAGWHFFVRANWG